MAKIDPISGFPEWLPEQRIVEQIVLDDLRRRFESYGFAPLETRAVEPLEHLLAKGETDKEIYVLRRLHDDGGGDAGLGLHFDLTIPLARYVQQFRGQLAFPFKRYQVQKVWRGERPQAGRYREFTQADLDVVDLDTLSLHFDSEMARLLVECVGAMPHVPELVLGLNNRKVLQGAYESLGIEDLAGTLRIVDKLDKVGERGVREMLVAEGLTEAGADLCLALGRIATPDASFADAVRSLGLSGARLDEGLHELTLVMDALGDLPRGRVMARLSIARGLDYYTGTVYEGQLTGHEDFGAVCSGGRYDDLVGGGTKLRLPGVGVSIGVTRMMGLFLGQGLLSASRPVPTCVLVVLPSEETRAATRDLANGLRARGVATEVFHEPRPFGKQLKYAQKRGIPYVWFPPTEDGAPHEVKDLATGGQIAADPATWMPAADALHPHVVRR